MVKGLAAAIFFALLGLLAFSAACGGGGDGGGPAIDIKDFDTARFTMTQTSTTGEKSSELAGEGFIDNRKQALSVTYQGGPGGFGRPYWPKFWLDAVQVEELGGQSLQGGETTGYRLSFDLDKVAKRLRASEATEPLDVRQAEVEVWVQNESRYAVQLTFRLELAFGTNSTKLEITSDFSDFGTEVDIEAPAEVATPTPT
jgi:hypothetical protein